MTGETKLSKKKFFFVKKFNLSLATSTCIVTIFYLIIYTEAE